MAQAGTLDVGVNVDPSGMIRGFGRSKAEIQKFERSFNSSTRSMGSAFTNMAVDFAASGDVGVRGIKRLAESGIGLAGVFGPQGLIVAAVGTLAITLWNWHDRARDEAAKTEEAYRKLTTTFSLMARTQAVAEFDIDPDKGGKLTKALQRIEDMRAELRQFGEFGTRGLPMGPGGRPTALSDLIAAAETAIKPLVQQRQRLVDLVTFEANSQQRLSEATAIVARREEQRRDALRDAAQWSKQILSDLSKLSAPEKLPSVWEDLKQGPPLKVDAFEEIKRNSERAKETLKRHAEEWEQTWGRAIDSTTFAFSNFFSNVLSGQITKFRDFASALLGIWIDMIAQMLAAQASAKIFDFLGIGLGAVGGAGGSAAGGAVGPIGSHGIPTPSAVGAGASSQVNVNFNISAMDGPSVARVLQGAQGEIVRLVAQGMQGSRQAKQAIQGSA